MKAAFNRTHSLTLAATPSSGQRVAVHSLTLAATKCEKAWRQARSHVEQ
jgi:hypothetical protein